MKYDSLISLHVNQDYGAYDNPILLDIQNIVKKYCLFPNEALYLVDCQHAQMEPLTNNFEKITGIDASSKCELLPLYEHVHPGDTDIFIKYTESLLRYGFYTENNFNPEKDFNISIYRTFQNKVILKSTTVLVMGSNHKPRFTIGKLMDVTGLIPYHHFAYKFVGPSSTEVYKAVENQIAADSILSRREIEVLKCTGMGFSTIDIASKLNISRHTVDTHKRSIIKKLNASNSVDAYNRAKSMGLF